jgi:hypothetical protein
VDNWQLPTAVLKMDTQKQKEKSGIHMHCASNGKEDMLLRVHEL